MSEEERIRELVMEHLQIDDSMLSPEVTLAELGCDSLTMLELLTALEDEFDIHLDDERFDACEDLGQIYRFISDRIREEK